MRNFLALLALLLIGTPLLSQSKAADGTFQISVPSSKFSENMVIADQTLEEIENYRHATEDRTMILTNGMKVLVISQQRVDEGRLVFKWKIEKE